MHKWLLRLSLLAILALAYGLALAPGLTWANNGTDGGDLISAVATRGVPHPSGYPLYLLLAGLFQHFPFGSLAFRTNLMSAFCSILAAGLLFELLKKQLNASLPALLGTLAYGLSPLVWSQAVITEVYALHALLSVAVLSVFLCSVRKPHFLIGQGWLLGLAMGNHLTALLMFPLLVFSQPPVASGKKDKLFFSRQYLRVIALRCAGLFLGLSVYIILPLRAGADPPVNWGDPVTLGNLWWLVSAQVYRENTFILSVPGFLSRLQGWAGFLLPQFTPPGLLLALYGALGPLPARLRLATLWILAAFSLFALLHPYPDSWVHLLPVLIALSVWVAFALQDISAALARVAFPWRPLFNGLCLAALLVRSLALFPQLDASRDTRAEDFGRRLIASAPRDALVFTGTDQETFTLWYFHYALGYRPDLVVIATGLLDFEWYQDTLAAAYPDLALPVPFPSPATISAANPHRPACHARHSGGPVIHCPSPSAPP